MCSSVFVYLPQVPHGRKSLQPRAAAGRVRPIPRLKIKFVNEPPSLKKDAFSLSSLRLCSAKLKNTNDTFISSFCVITLPWPAECMANHTGPAGFLSSVGFMRLCHGSLTPVQPGTGPPLRLKKETKHKKEKKKTRERPY